MKSVIDKVKQCVDGFFGIWETSDQKFVLLPTFVFGIMQCDDDSCGEVHGYTVTLLWCNFETGAGWMILH